MPKQQKKLSEAIREAAKREGLGVEEFRRKHELPNDSYYAMLRDEDPIPERSMSPLKKLKKAGVQHPLLDMLAA